MLKENGMMRVVLVLSSGNRKPPTKLSRDISNSALHGSNTWTRLEDCNRNGRTSMPPSHTSYSHLFN
jgi:hypothetical protein